MTLRQYLSKTLRGEHNNRAYIYNNVSLLCARYYKIVFDWLVKLYYNFLLCISHMIVDDKNIFYHNKIVLFWS